MYKQLAISFFFVLVVAITFYVIRRMMKAQGPAYSKQRVWLTLAFICYLSAVAAVTIVPLRASRTEMLDHHFNFVPVKESYHRFVYLTRSDNRDGIRNFYGNFFGNILMFMPMGLFLPLLYKKRFVKMLVVAALSSCCIEFIQYLNMYIGYYRYVDIDDVILNTSGAIIGFWLYKVFFHARKNTGI
jgi:glycopeptide antibiotics resistance protein